MLRQSVGTPGLETPPAHIPSSRKLRLREVRHGGYALPDSSAESFPKKSFPEKKQAK
jgi:hypothetical protein